MEDRKSKRKNCCAVLAVDSAISGRVIAKYRKNKKMTQEVLSGLCGINRTHLSAIERGLRSPTLATFIRICYAMGVEATTVISEIEKQLPIKKEQQP